MSRFVPPIGAVGLFLGLILLAGWFQGPKAPPADDVAAMSPHDRVVQANAWTGLGLLDWEQGDTGAAAGKFRMALIYDPGNPEAMINLASVLMAEAGKNLDQKKRGLLMEEVIGLYADALERRPNSEVGWRNLSAAFKNIGLEAESQAALARARELAVQ